MFSNIFSQSVAPQVPIIIVTIKALLLLLLLVRDMGPTLKARPAMLLRSLQFQSAQVNDSRGYCINTSLKTTGHPRSGFFIAKTSWGGQCR